MARPSGTSSRRLFERFASSAKKRSSSWLVALQFLAELLGRGFVAITEAQIENYRGIYLSHPAGAEPLRLIESNIVIDLNPPPPSPILPGSRAAKTLCRASIAPECRLHDASVFRKPATALSYLHHMFLLLYSLAFLRELH
jgi:hypothetical protein